MEAEKRKRGDGAGESSSKRKKETKGEVTVTDSEVEEFYAILRRIHVAVTYLKKGNGRGSLKNAFELEDFERVDDIEQRGGGEKRLRFDLNVEPDDEAE
ncbi:hypothetical protein ACET3Z_031990 [Daucus carota]